jgi:ELWxxDGT repeat protein
MPSFPSSQFPLALALLLVVLVVPLAAAANEPPFAADGPSVWRDGVWQPLDAGVEVAPAERASAFRSTAAAATNEGSQIRSIVPLFEPDGSAKVAVFGAAVDGETCLWRTDGTAAGTFRVEPAGSCLPVELNPFVVAIADGIAYFIAEPSAPRYWRTDGTATGTWPLTSFSDSGLFGGSISLFPVPPLGLVLFVANDDVHGPELWVSDGGPENAQRLAAPGLDGFPFRFQILGSEVLFFVFRDGFEYELWKTDGTAAGTSLVEVVGSAQYPGGPRSAYSLGERVVFFLGSGHPCIVQLWTSDGTAAGTEPIRSFDGPSCAISGQFQAARVAGLEGSILFDADDGTNGGELWRTDGTVAGTERLTDFAPAQPFLGHFPLNFPPVGLGGAIFFAANDGFHGMEPWKSDGTPGGASLLADICPGTCSSSPGWMRVVGGQLLFSAEEPSAGRELWASNGTSAGTKRVTDLCPGPCGATISRETPFGDSLLFIADDGSHGEEWWIFHAAGRPGGAADRPGTCEAVRKLPQHGAPGRPRRLHRGRRDPRPRALGHRRHACGDAPARRPPGG